MLLRENVVCLEFENLLETVLFLPERADAARTV